VTDARRLRAITSKYSSNPSITLELDPSVYRLVGNRHEVLLIAQMECSTQASRGVNLSRRGRPRSESGFTWGPDRGLPKRRASGPLRGCSGWTRYMSSPPGAGGRPVAAAGRQRVRDFQADGAEVAVCSSLRGCSLMTRGNGIAALEAGYSAEAAFSRAFKKTGRVIAPADVRSAGQWPITALLTIRPLTIGHNRRPLQK
jgi:hypothetical protein